MFEVSVPLAALRDEAKDHRIDYECTVETFVKIYKAIDDADAKLKKFPKGTMGITPDKVKSDPKYKKAKAEYEKASSDYVNLIKKFQKGVPKDLLKKNAVNSIGRGGLTTGSAQKMHGSKPSDHFVIVKLNSGQIKIMYLNNQQEPKELRQYWGSPAYTVLGYADTFAEAKKIREEGRVRDV